ncbi:MAG: hypothetical protein AVDCRST_MAG50-835, partial [uncultured Acidimicrobiales bacterium]
AGRRWTRGSPRCRPPVPCARGSRRCRRHGGLQLRDGGARRGATTAVAAAGQQDQGSQRHAGPDPTAHGHEPRFMAFTMAHYHCRRQSDHSSPRGEPRSRPQRNRAYIPGRALRSRPARTVRSATM